MAPSRPPADRPRGRVPASASPRARLVPWIVATIAALTFAGTLGADYTLDDVEIVRDDPRLESLQSLPRLYADDYWGHIRYGDHGLYRPTTLASFALQRAILGPHAWAYHAGNILLHAFATAALLLLLRSVFRDERVAFSSALLFAVHPVHVEAVAGIVGRAEILALLGVLGTVGASRRALGAPTRAGALGWGAAAVVCMLAGATSKESGGVAPVAVALTEGLAPTVGARARRRRIALLAALVAAGVVLLFARSRVVSAASVSSVFNGVDALSRCLTSLRVLAEYVGLLVAPVRLCADYSPDRVAIARSVGDAGVLAGIATLVASLVIAVRSARSRPSLSWGIALFLVALLPVSNLLFPIGVAKAERILYIPSAGFLTAAAAAGVALVGASRRRVLGHVALAIVTLAFFVRAVVRSRDWTDNCTLAAATVREAPESPMFLTMHARCLMEAGDVAEARRFLDRAFAAHRDFPTAHLVAGVLEEREGHLEAALAHDDAILRDRPEHVGALSRSAVLLSNLARSADAAARYERWARAAPQDPRPWAGLIKEAAESGDFARAREVASEGLSKFPRDELVRRNAAVLDAQLRELGATSQPPSSGGRTPENAR